jgi:hypothetical protein
MKRSVVFYTPGFTARFHIAASVCPLRVLSMYWGTIVNKKLKAITPHFDRRSDFDARLVTAHARIETTFLDGGAVLVSVMDILNSLVTILDRMTGTLDGSTTENTVAGLNKTIADLAGLPQTEENRQGAFNELTHLCSSTRDHIDDIRETFRYLRTFAITVKITGAGLSEFAAFADEIRERIQSGADEVGKFAELLTLMRMQLDKARKFSSTILEDFTATIPTIVTGLNENSSQIGHQHQQMSAIARQVKAVAQGVQGKIASVLSALQIGDITRQRIEHIQSSLQLFDDYARSPEGFALGETTLDAMQNVILHLANAQLDETAADFQRDCKRIFSNISSFAEDAAEILSLRDELLHKLGAKDKNVLSLMEKDITEACKLATRVQESSNDANAVVQSVTQTAHDLLHGIEVLRSIKTDIHYMALNSNLRCSKLGVEGRAVNVVSGELRTFAAKLETPADAIVAELRRVETAAQMLGQDAGNTSGDLSQPLRDALGAIQGAKAQMDNGLQDLATEGQAVFSRITAAVTKLDFEKQLGDVLEECLVLSSELAAAPISDISALEGDIMPLSEKIYRLYTMAQERDVHLRYLPWNAGQAKSANTTTASVQDNDDDLFADALF